MTPWTGIVLAITPTGSDAMESRLATCLHPVAGRPLIWHTLQSLAALSPRPARACIVTDGDVSLDLFQGIDLEIELVRVGVDDFPHMDQHLAARGSERALVLDATAPVLPERLQLLLACKPGQWLAAQDGSAAAAWIEFAHLAQLFRLPEPLTPPNGVLSARTDLEGVPAAIRVRNRAQLAEVVRRVRDRAVDALMRRGVTFLLPESVIVDVDVRIGRDTVVYPGVVLEGQTTIGEETVIGPGCRVIDSWIGSGVEMKGWNYVSHSSIRNRAILEPYVRRGFD
jgi:bifunctional N-acetylglucosamine-1-phosphate-uridyltransferase/glucosamine-1-phosphate-acetyltransferase GlmU-like protein